MSRLRGRLALSLRDGATALRWFRAADQAEPDHHETLNGLAQALRLNGDETAAASYFAKVRAQERLRELLLRSADATTMEPAQLFELAKACETANYLAEARAWYQLVLLTEPLNAAAQQALFRLAKRA